MASYKHPYDDLRVLLIDDLSAQQTALRGQLAAMGMSQVDMASGPDEALRYLKSRAYQLVLCDYNLNSRTDGQQLFEYARDQGLLREDSLFFMVTAESQYGAVASASEHAPDAYLLKPFTIGDIEERLQTQLDRRAALADITQAMAAKQWKRALQAAEAAVARKDRWALAAMQLQGRLFLNLGMVDEAQALYQRVLAMRNDLLWAKVGLMRALKAGGQLEDCRNLAQEVLATPEGARNIPTFDLLADAQESLGDTAGALDTLYRAAEVVPSARRFRRMGDSAYRQGDLGLAKSSYQKAWKSSQTAVTAQPTDALILAQTHVELGETQEALRLLKSAGESAPRSPALEGVAQAIRAQAHAAEGQTELAQKATEAALATSRGQSDEFARMALGRAALATGRKEEGLKLFAEALSHDHEDPLIERMVIRSMKAVGFGDQAESLVESSKRMILDQVARAKRTLREGDVDEAVRLIGETLRDYPQNPAVLLECAQMHCLWLRRQGRRDVLREQTIHTQLARLERLLPGEERVAKIQRFLRETLADIDAKAESSS